MRAHRVVGIWQQEVEWICKIAKKKVVIVEMLYSVFAMVVYSTWRDRNMIRFQHSRSDAMKTCHEIVMHLHIQGRNKASWWEKLQLMNYFL